jgi:hypothetical protein
MSGPKLLDLPLTLADEKANFGKAEALVPKLCPCDRRPFGHLKTTLSRELLSSPDNSGESVCELRDLGEFISYIFQGKGEPSLNSVLPPLRNI